MFTGIIKTRGEVGQIARHGGDMRMTIIAAGLPWHEFEIGESISVNGVCLTVAELMDEGFIADVSAETLAVTTMKGLARGSAVNIEPALSLGERLGGHLVSGHTDCTGTIRAREVVGVSVKLQIEVPVEFRRYIARKGSVCVDGVSLTVNSVSDAGFEVNIIPHTVEVTIIGAYRVGTEVNIEVDMLARYLENLLIGRDGSGMTKEFLRVFLREQGYV